MKPVFAVVFVLALIYAVVLFFVAVKCELPGTTVGSFYLDSSINADSIYRLEKKLDFLKKVNSNTDIKEEILKAQKNRIKSLKSAIEREDTLIDFHRTPASAWLDSVARVDSLKLKERSTDCR